MDLTLVQQQLLTAVALGKLKKELGSQAMGKH